MPDLHKKNSCSDPASTTHRPDVGPMLGQRLRRWPNISPTLDRCLVCAGDADDTLYIHTALWREPYLCRSHWAREADQTVCDSLLVMAVRQCEIPPQGAICYAQVDGFVARSKWETVPNDFKQL